MDRPRHMYSSSHKKFPAPHGTHGSLLHLQEPPLVPPQSHVNTVHNLRSILILFSNLWLGVPTKWPLSFRFPHQNPVCLLPIYATCPTHLILLDLIPQKISDGKYKPWSSSLCSILLSPVIFPLRAKDIPHQTSLKHPQFINFPSCEICVVQHYKRQLHPVVWHNPTCFCRGWEKPWNIQSP